MHLSLMTGHASGVPRIMQRPYPMQFNFQFHSAVQVVLFCKAFCAARGRCLRSHWPGWSDCVYTLRSGLWATIRSRTVRGCDGSAHPHLRGRPQAAHLPPRHPGASSSPWHRLLQLHRSNSQAVGEVSANRNLNGSVSQFCSSFRPAAVLQDMSVVGRGTPLAVSQVSTAGPGSRLCAAY